MRLEYINIKKQLFLISITLNIMEAQTKMFFLLLVAGFLASAQSAKILVIFPVAAPSHYILGSSLAKDLAERGHDVTMISPYSEKTKPKNGSYRDIVLTGFIEEMEEMRKMMNPFDSNDKNVFLMALFMSTMTKKLCGNVFEHPNVKELVNSDETFDLIIVEQFMNDAHKAFGAHFKAPVILFSTVGANVWVNDLVGNPAPTSYIPHMLLAYSAQMTFWQRFYNTIFVLYSRLIAHFLVYPEHNKVVQSYFPQDNIQFYDLLYNSSLVFLNSHISINQAVPTVPNMIDIGGFHVKPPKKLPSDLKTYLDNAKEGVIYFSLGSHLKSKNMPLEKRQVFLDTFAKLKLKVLWKFEDDELPGKPENVKIVKWLPQNDILAHPNVKLFVTHGGLLSTTETVYHGMPVLAIPIMGDQKMNAHNIVNNGLGLSVSFLDVTQEILLEKLQELLTNPTYRENAKIRSQIFHDRQNKPMDTAAYWVDYVIRHKGAPHLRVAALDLPWYQYHSLDVFALVGIIVLTVLGVHLWILKKIVCKFFCSKKAVTASKNKKDQ